MSDTQYDTHDHELETAALAEGTPGDVPTAAEAVEADDLGSPSPMEPAEVGEPAEAADHEAVDAGEHGTTDDAPTDDTLADDTETGDDLQDESTGGGRRGPQRVSQLEREGEVAADFLETLLDIADLDGDIEVDIDGDRAAVSVVDSEEGRVPRRLVGQQGKVLEALQELTRLAVQTATGERSRLMLDVAGHRAERRVSLVAVAQAAISTVRQTGERTVLDDMTAFERKIVHDEVAAAGLDSESEGVEPHRHIIVLPG